MELAQSFRRCIFIKTPEYVVYLETFSGKIYAHADVFKWDKRVKKDFVERFTRLADKCVYPIYAVNLRNGFDKRHKFLQMVGFRFYRNKYVYGELNAVYRRFS